MCLWWWNFYTRICIRSIFSRFTCEFLSPNRQSLLQEDSLILKSRNALRNVLSRCFYGIRLSTELFVIEKVSWIIIFFFKSEIRRILYRRFSPILSGNFNFELGGLNEMGGLFDSQFDKMDIIRRISYKVFYYNFPCRIRLFPELFVVRKVSRIIILLHRRIL